MVFETERLVVRKFNNEDIDLIYDINNDPECIKFNGWDSMSYEDCQDVLRNWIEEYSTFALTGAFCVESKNEISKVGMAFIVEKDKHGEFEIGFRLRRVHWDKGYAKEITFGFINYSRNKINANSLIEEIYRETSSN
ncbi:GNAT family N-acetyltransferase [Clostridium senegalense]|uniref:GNAT family N-acetyltransferase n=1 Tax=Clostridium senegalense TaxID=1465809 RepID=A0A6M0H2T3_9CLOT|nr:GNAT family N-acetyltransferase [Clostridium senegalense]NEU04847.1 GNAT family N-acetyltransferase [Clostridium senegalense]